MKVYLGYGYEIKHLVINASINGYALRPLIMN